MSGGLLMLKQGFQIYYSSLLTEHIEASLSIDTIFVIVQ